jgi:hypothetical protein
VTEPEKEAGRPKQGRGAAPKTGAPRQAAGIPVPALSGLTERPQSLPVYGNYCGRGHGDPTYQTPPVDAVDAACREHNRCYALLGDFDSRCDRRFVKLLPAAIAETPSREGKNAGLLALLYFSAVEPNLALGETLFEGGGTQEQQGTDRDSQAARGVQDTAGRTRETVGGLGAGQGQGDGERSGERDTEDRSSSAGGTATVGNDKGPKGPLAELLNLDILPPPNSETTALETGDSGDHRGPAGG